MQFLLRLSTRVSQLPRLSSIREYTTSTFLSPPASTVALGQNRSPQSGNKQEKQETAEVGHHWVETSATISEADVSCFQPQARRAGVETRQLLTHILQVKADRDSIEEELHSKKVEEQIAAFGDRPQPFMKAYWADS